MIRCGLCCAPEGCSDRFVLCCAQCREHKPSTGTNGEGSCPMSLNKAQGMTRGCVGLGVQTLMACFIRCDFPVPPHLSRESHKG